MILNPLLVLFPFVSTISAVAIDTNLAELDAKSLVHDNIARSVRGIVPEERISESQRARGREIRLFSLLEPKVESFIPRKSVDVDSALLDQVSNYWSLNNNSRAEEYPRSIPFDAEILDSSRMPFIHNLGSSPKDKWNRYVGINLNYTKVERIFDYVKDVHNGDLQNRGEAVRLFSTL